MSRAAISNSKWPPTLSKASFKSTEKASITVAAGSLKKSIMLPMISSSFSAPVVETVARPHVLQSLQDTLRFPASAVLPGAVLAVLLWSVLSQPVRLREELTGQREPHSV